MNHHSSTIKKYYPALIGAALIAASLFQFSRPVFSAGTAAGQKIRNTATGNYEDDAGNDYTIDSNTVEVTVAKVAGITNMPTGFTDGTTGSTNNSVLTGDTVSFEFTITNVGNDISDIYIPDAANIKTKGLNTSSLVVTVTGINPVANPSFNPYPTDGIVKNVPINGKIIVKVTGTVNATPTANLIEVQLGDTGSNGAPGFPNDDTQNQFDDGGSIAGYPDDVKKAPNEVRTLNATPLTPGTVALTDEQQKEASAVKQVTLGSNPRAMVKIEKTSEIDDTSAANTNPALDDNVITYNLGVEVLSNSPSAQYTAGKLSGRDFGNRITGIASANASNLILVSDAIPKNTVLQDVPTGSLANWTPVYAVSANGTEPAYDSTKNLAADQLQWTTTIPSDKTTITRVGWVYDARATTSTPAGKGPLDVGTTIPGFKFNVVTTGLTSSTGGTISNLAQVFGATDGATGADSKVFDESGDQDPSNFNGPNPGPSETATGSTGIADPATHDVDTNNDNTATGSEGGEDNVVNIAKPGVLTNGPDGKPGATGKIFGIGPNNNHDFQNKGIANFDTVSCTAATTNPATSFSGNPQSGRNCTLNPVEVTFTNTINPGQSILSNVLLQPVRPSFDGLGGTDANLPTGTKVTIKYGTEQAIYTYTLNGLGVGSFALDPGTTANPNNHIKIASLAANVPLDYTVIIDLPAGTKLSTDAGNGFAVPIIAFADLDSDNTPDSNENSNYTINQVYTDFIKLEKQVKVLMPDGTIRAGMDFADPNANKNPLPGDTLVYRVNYRNISEPDTGNGNLILTGKSVMIDENGTQAKINGMAATGNNWGLDNNNDGDLDTINVQNTATDNSNGSSITYYTGTSPVNAPSKYSVGSLTSAGTTDPGETVTGYRVTIPELQPSASKSNFEFQRKVDEYDNLLEEGLN
jgi:hypothetical protein